MSQKIPLFVDEGKKYGAFFFCKVKDIVVLTAANPHAVTYIRSRFPNDGASSS
jgi:hypothetical protein